MRTVLFTGTLLLAIAAGADPAPGAVAQGAIAQGAIEDGDARVEAELLVDSLQVRPGDRFRVGVRFRMDEDWHIYWRNPGDSGLSSEILWNAPGVDIGPLQWPFPKTFRTPDDFIVTHGYADEVLLFAEATAPESADAPLVITAQADLLACKVNCIPAAMSLSRKLPVSGTTQPDPEAIALFDAASAQVPVALESLGWTATTTLAGGTLRPGEPFEGLVAVKTAGDTPMPTVSGDFFVPDRVEGIARITLTPDPAVPGHFQLSGEAAPDAPSAPPRLRGVLRFGTDAFKAVELDLPLLSPGATAPADLPNPPAPSAALMLLFAFLGGALLNLMPCVFPVLALKVYGLARVATEDRRHLGVHALAYAGGIVVSLLALAAGVIALRAAGQSVGWGFQFQEPLFVAGVSAVLVAFALNLFGVFRIGQPGTGLAAQVEGTRGIGRSAGEGVLTVVLATPCSAPLLGVAVGFALASGPGMTLATFGVLGLGLAAPFCALVLSPGLARRLPRPGAWMERLKQVLGFALVGTAVWLVWVLGGLAGVDGMGRVLAFLVAVAAGAWVLGFSQDGSARQRTVGRVAAILLVAAGAGLTLRFTEPTTQKALTTVGARSAMPWSEDEVKAALAKGRPSFVYFTADWCLTCKFNERTVLSSDAVQQAFTDHDVAVFIADWTKRDARISEALGRHGRAGVPMYLVFGPGGAAPEVLPELLTPDLIVRAVAQAAGSNPQLKEKPR